MGIPVHALRVRRRTKRDMIGKNMTDISEPPFSCILSWKANKNYKNIVAPGIEPGTFSEDQASSQASVNEKS